MPASWRIMPARHLVSPLDSGHADSRFCSRDAGYTVLYASPDFATAFVETVVRDRFTRRRNRNVGFKKITGRVWTRISVRAGAELTLLELRGDGCTRIGAPSDAVHARNHAAGRALANAIHAEHADIEGLVYVSRLTGEDAHAVFDRGVGKLNATETGMLMDHPAHNRTMIVGALFRIATASGERAGPYQGCAPARSAVIGGNSRRPL